VGLQFIGGMDASANGSGSDPGTAFPLRYGHHGRGHKVYLYITEANVPMIFLRNLPKEGDPLPVPF
jgi:hypothetical protein